MRKDWLSSASCNSHASGSAVSFQALQISAQFGSVLIAKCTILFKGLMNYAIEFRRKLRVEPPGRHRIFVQDRVEHCSRRCAIKGHGTRGHLVKHHAEGEKIRARVKIFTQGLLR